MDTWRAPLSPDPLVQERPEVIGHPWRLLVVCILCNRTKGRDAYPVALELFRRWPDPATMAQADPGELEPLLRPLGLFRQRAAGLVKMSRQYAEGERNVPALFGCGQYAVDAWAIFVEGRTDVFPQDGHLNRYVEWRVACGTWGARKPGGGVSMFRGRHPVQDQRRLRAIRWIR
jgi:methyl-CpG-binding domain protein 4